jgi:hypothetical protein
VQAQAFDIDHDKAIATVGDVDLETAQPGNIQQMIECTRE